MIVLVLVAVVVIVVTNIEEYKMSQNKENHIGFIVYEGDEHISTVIKSKVGEQFYNDGLKRYQENDRWTILYIYESPSLVSNDEVMIQLRVIADILYNADNEIAEAPYWLIIDPHQSFSCDIHDIASMITGPFFSREDATMHLENRSYGFGKYAKVYCHSGHWSYEYKKLCNLLKIGYAETKKKKDAVANKDINISTTDEVK